MTDDTDTDTDFDGFEPETDHLLTDPDSLADRADVDRTEHTFVHGSEDHCEGGYAGRAIVGVTNDTGEVLLRIHRESGAGALPNAKVEAGDDWAAAAVRGVREQTGVDVEIDAVIRLRAADHRVEDAETPFEATTHVVFRTSPVSAADPRSDADGVVAEWRDALPAANDGDRPADDDVRLFVD